MPRAAQPTELSADDLALLRRALTSGPLLPAPGADTRRARALARRGYLETRHFESTGTTTYALAQKGYDAHAAAIAAGKLPRTI